MAEETAESKILSVIWLRYSYFQLPMAKANQVRAQSALDLISNIKTAGDAGDSKIRCLRRVALCHASGY